MTYKIEIWNPATNTRIADLTGLARNLSFNVAKNTAESVSFNLELSKFEYYCESIHVLPQEVLKLNVYDVRIYRGETPILGAELRYASFNLSENTRTIQVKAVGFLDRLKRRFAGFTTLRTFTTTDAGAIAKTLIDEAQAETNGNMYLTTNSSYIEATQQRTITYDKKSIAEAILELASMEDGFDFEFTYDRKFYVYSAIGNDRTDILFLEYPKNISSLVAPFDGSNMINSVMARGSGYGSTQLYQVVTDSAKGAEYGLLQGIVDSSSTETTTLLSALATENKDKFKDIFKLPQFTLNGDFARLKVDYWIGDIIRVAVKQSEYLKTLDSDWIIEGITVSLDEEGAETVNIQVRS